VDFIGFRYRDISVSPQLMELRQWQNLANSGCISLYIMGTLGNHRDTSAFEPTKKVFAFHAAHEELFTQMKSAAKTVLVRSGMLAREDPEGYGWVRVLTESHIPFDEIKATELADIRQLEGKKLLILGDLKGASPKLLALADEFAQQGGVVISAGETGLTKDGCALKCMGISGILGNMFAETVCKMFGIQEPIAKGIAIGCSSHAMGTVKALEMGEVEGAMSSLSIAIAGILTVVAASVFATLL
jgi:hypothetical protein